MNVKAKGQVPEELVEAINEGSSFLLASHIGLDGDHLGSMLALGSALRKIGKDVYCFLPERVPENFGFLPGLDQLRKEFSEDGFDTLITLECPDQQRLPSEINIEQLQNKGVKILNLDHHPDNENYGDVLWVVPDAAALGEMILDLLNRLEIPLDTEVATCLYTAILTDTGSFQYSRVTPETHIRIAQLLEHKVPTDEVARQLYRHTRAPVVKLLGSVLSRVQITPDGKLAYAELSLKDLVDLKVDDSETRFFIDDIDRVQGPEVVAIFKEMSELKVKVSLRSRRKAINQVAARFGGGGHPMAAGCVVDGSLDAVRDQVVSAVIETLDRTT